MRSPPELLGKGVVSVWRRAKRVQIVQLERFNKCTQSATFSSINRMPFLQMLRNRLARGLECVSATRACNSFILPAE